MKLNDLYETASGGVTSVASIGTVEVQAFPDRIKMFKRDQLGCAKCVATIKRKTGKGWSFVTTSDWGNLSLPHYGHLSNIKSDYNGKKTITKELSGMLKAWGISHGEIQSYRD